MGSAPSAEETITQLEGSIIMWEAYARLHPDEADSCNETISKIQKKIKETELQKVTGGLAKTLNKSAWFSNDRSDFYQNVETVNRNLDTHSKLESAPLLKKPSPKHKKVYNNF